LPRLLQLQRLPTKSASGEFAFWGGVEEGMPQG
jgi:hypothetical protein